MGLPAEYRRDLWGFLLNTVGIYTGNVTALDAEARRGILEAERIAQILRPAPTTRERLNNPMRLPEFLNNPIGLSLGLPTDNVRALDAEARRGILEAERQAQVCALRTRLGVRHTRHSTRGCVRHTSGRGGVLGTRERRHAAGSSKLSATPRCGALRPHVGPADTPSRRVKRVSDTESRPQGTLPSWRRRTQLRCFC